jgi:2-polyprenyl-6-methoxyphenol hydroxylase-like FAD-dependent oxidoreductase
MAAVEKVLVLGGGIGGQAAAIALAKAGIAVEIAEIQKDFNVYGVGIIQQQNALRALDCIGLSKETLEKGYAYGQVLMYTAHGHFVGKGGAPASEKFPSHNGISRRVLHEIMFSEAQRLKIPYRMGVTIESIDNVDSGVVVHFSDGTSDTFDIMIASDGINSKARKLLFGDIPIRYMGLSVWRYAFPKHEDLDTGYIYYGKRSKIGFIPMSDDSMYMFLVSAEGKDLWLDKHKYVPMLQDYLSEYPVKIAQDASRQITDPNLVNYRPLEAVRISGDWYKGNCIIIGDGAHATVPQLGSGAALALEDAVVLVEELQKATSVKEAFEKFMKRRYDRCMSVVHASETLAEWELMEFQGQKLPDGANPGMLIGKTSGELMAPF